jgi:hypothetical protein
LKFEFKTPLSTARRLKKPRKAQEIHLEEGNHKSQHKTRKAVKPSKIAKKSSKGLKRARKVQNQHRRSKE